MNQINKVAIIGVGLMGGSLALALKDKFSHLTVVGFARSTKSFKKLLKLGILDLVEKDLKLALRDADLVVIGAPVYATIAYLKVIGRFLKPGTIICDLSSTKELIDAQAKNVLPKTVSFIGCHPLCGSEKHGAEFSRKDLYKDSICLITNQTSLGASLVKEMWVGLGAKVIFIDSRKHDAVLSVLSHLPHLVAFSLIQASNQRNAQFKLRSFNDMTRIAASPAEVWADIFVSNRNNLLKHLEKFLAVTKKFKSLLKSSNKAGLIKLINQVNVKYANIIKEPK